MGDHKHTNSIIGIDHNLDFIKHSIHNPTQLYLELNLDSNMIPTITRPTRVTQSSATLIDNLFISHKLQDNYKSGILINDTSDHMPCYVILPDTTDHKLSLKTITYRNFNENVKTKICEHINAVDWPTELDVTDVNEAFSKFHCMLTTAIEKFAPTKTKHIRPNKQPSAKWLTSGIINSINLNKELYKKSIQKNVTTESKT